MEQWKSINAYPDYEISSHGNVRSVRFNRILKPAKSDSGYLYVNLLNNKIRKTTAVHKLVIEHFGLTMPGENFVVDHLDKNKEHNSITNLEWVSIQENTIRSYGNQHKIPIILELRNKGFTYKQISEQVELGMSTVHQIVIKNS
jgi:hypothetical protein